MRIDNLAPNVYRAFCYCWGLSKAAIRVHRGTKREPNVIEFLKSWELTYDSFPRTADITFSDN
ncbi:hypothetical protein CA13_30340 [Planctomycetes bacterium CA13]|uniref:Uncharacterized protein n=1 Tax=Novipirellula herctigrandis TaxID=2527986 RepID=A0A5C5Z426_9BACT|nr:hypothetical protein CA13_30340 [Planctomycetes bacterium CA13]